VVACPIEISTRGARFAEEADRAAARDEVAFENLEATVKQLAQRLRDAQIEIDWLKDVAESDSTQPEIDSTG
jgi:hypothetical protein